jgi:DNA/RNA-binding protein KIN17
MSKCWLLEGIVVKIISKELKKEGFYKEKARVLKVVPNKQGRTLAEVEHIKSGAVLRVDQSQLETVIPKAGGHVLLLKGSYKGSKAVLLQINSKRFQAQVELLSSSTSHEDKTKFWVEYDDISKCIT